MRYERVYFAYIMTNKMNTTLYVGVTNNIERRSLEHKSGKGGCFTGRYNCNKLVYYEEFDYVLDAIAREKELKGWSRKKKEELINEDNPLWEDLSKDWHEEDAPPTDCHSDEPPQCGCEEESHRTAY